MKRSWISISVVGAVLGLLTLLAALQYKWLSAAGEAERDRMQKRVEADASRLAEDFNREMQSAYFNFQTSPETWRGSEWSEFNERYDFWKERTAQPELIRDIHFFGKDSGSGPFIYDAAERLFESAETGLDLERLRTRIADEKSFTPFYDDAYAMVVPIYDTEKRIEHVLIKRSEGDGPMMPRMKMPEPFGWLVVRLDESVIKEKILPELVRKYFPENDFQVGVIDRSGQTIFATGTDLIGEDARASLFNLSPDNLLFFSTREAIPSTNAEEHRRDFVINKRVESHTFSAGTAESEGETFQFELQSPGLTRKPRTAMIAKAREGSDPWTLRVQHTTGSINQFVENERNKSLLIGLGIYLLLVGGIAAILLSALRSKRFAQRQIDFVSSVSHEFRTPLAVIYTAGENLADGITKDEGQVSRYGELIKGEGKKLSGMVEQILEFAGASSGRRKYSFAKTDVTDVVEDALQECRPLIESNGFTIERDLQDGLPEISVDRTALSGAIQNLIANSVKYSNGSKWIRISTANGGGSVKIVVQDHGIGISGDELRRIFEPFYRVKEVVDGQISGNGLGLNLVKKIVEGHGGKVSAASKPGSGSTFTIELPQNPSGR